MNEILQYMLVGAAVVIIVVNLALALSPRFRRWVYSKD